MTDANPRAQVNPIDDYAGKEINDLALSESTREFESIYPYHRDPGYRPWLRTNTPLKPTHHEEILAMMAKNINYAVMASRFTLVFSMILALDIMLPKYQSDEEVIGYHLSSGDTYQMELKDGKVINMSKKAVRKLKTKALTISWTRLFAVPYSIADKENNKASIEISIYGNFIFGPFAMLLTSLIGVLQRKGVEFRFNLGVASFVLALLNIAFLNVYRL